MLCSLFVVLNVLSRDKEVIRVSISHPSLSFHDRILSPANGLRSSDAEVNAPHALPWRNSRVAEPGVFQAVRVPCGQGVPQREQ